eukprot:g8703.t1
MMYFLPLRQPITIGANTENKIVLQGLGMPEHLCEIENLPEGVVPETGHPGLSMKARVCVNGSAMKENERRKLKVNTNGETKTKCREEDLEEFRQRLQSFKTHWWFNKPLAVCPLAAARKGWSNIGQDTISCHLCTEELKIRYLKGCWLANGLPMADVSGASHEILENL